jgi:hypothetical protein
MDAGRRCVCFFLCLNLEVTESGILLIITACYVFYPTAKVELFILKNSREHICYLNFIKRFLY